ncbi:uncharacterized protein [Aristolochia californica]|uniref:uncharacterized protein isoform X2 n=1 Tax=Aristolochia californica TaxID=171875 RepID=UPI0035D9087B
MDFFAQDVSKLCSSIRHEEKKLKIKKSWLMGLPSWSRSRHVQKHTIVPNLLKDKSLFESFLRDEDVSADIVKRSIERGYRAFLSKQEELCVVEDYAQLFDTKMDEPSIIYRKTRPVMKKLVKRHLRKLFLESRYKEYIEPLSQIFMEQRNFREDCHACVTPISESLISAFKMVLGRLSDFCTLTLLAMQRKLKGVKYVPQLKYRYGWSRDRLIQNIHRICSHMLVEQNAGEELLEPLTKAMAVAALSLKVSGIFDFPVPEFLYFPPETKAIQNEILKALQALPKVRYVELKHVQHMLDPKTEIPTKKFRSTFRKLLIGYLFECGDVDVPKTLRKVIAFINRKSRRKFQYYFSREKMEEEVECVLDVSARLSQLIWDMLPDHEFDQEFAEAFMEDSESEISDNDESDVNEDKSSNIYFNLWLANPHMNLDKSIQLCGFHSDDEVESIGDSRPNASTLHFTSSNGRNENSNSSSDEIPKPEKINNRYLAIKDVCDEVSLVAHQLIGRLLESFADVEDVGLEPNVRSYCRGSAPSTEDTRVALGSWTPPKDSDLVLIQAVEEIIPSLTKSVTEKLKELELQ